MQKNNILSSFEYAVMPSMSSVAISHPAKNKNERYTPLWQVKMNFNDGDFLLTGNWHCIMASNTKAKPFRPSYHPGRVGIKADIFPGEINLNDQKSDGLVLPINGILQDDESSVNSCSGLIQFHKSTASPEVNHYEWTISICLYNYQHENREINFHLQLYIAKEEASKS